MHVCKRVTVPAAQGGDASTADPLSPAAAQEAGLCGESGEAAAGADTAAGGLREEGADGAAAAHTPGAGTGFTADAAGEDGVVCMGPQHWAFGIAFKEEHSLAALSGVTLLFGFRLLGFLPKPFLWMGLRLPHH